MTRKLPWAPGMPTTKRPRKQPLRGFILYRGPSMLDGSPIVVVATLETSNVKTGDMVQVWILSDGESSLSALQHGRNTGVCGICHLQGTPEIQPDGSIKMVDRVCYVNLGQAPQAIWDGLERGIYPVVDWVDDARWFANRSIRFGAYGDPTAMPDSLIDRLVSLASNWTGYSHQLFWIDRDRAERLARVFMCSTHTPAQTREAKRRGWRYFEAIREDQLPTLDSVECPAYTHGRQCADCTLCKGGSLQARSVHVIAHAKVGLNLGNVQALQGAAI